jgi:hypothetical protein
LRCNRSGVSLATLDGIFFDPASEGSRLMLWVKGGLGEDEKREIKRRMYRGRVEAALQGNIVAGGNAPYGYRFEHWGRKGYQKNLVIDEGQAATMRMIYELLAHGRDGRRCGTCAVANYLNEELRLHSPKGKMWHPATILAMVRRPLYRGEWAWRRRARPQAKAHGGAGQRQRPPPPLPPPETEG